MSENFHYGGQAVIEGVMMRGRRHMVTCVRRPDGELALNGETLSGIFTGRLRKLPLVRGIVVLVEAMVLGMRSLLFSASVALGEEEATKSSSAYLWAMVALAMVFAVALFFLAPLFLARLISTGDSSLLFNLVEGLIRIAFFIGYLKLISLMPDLRRVFAYHGAEHKTVNAYEAGAPFEVAQTRSYSKAHSRCGTSFLFVVVVIAVAVFALFGRPSIWLMVLSRVALVPVIAAISYEITYFGARHQNSPLVRGILMPGRWLQSLTTREPDDRQIEVAIAALKKLVEMEETA
ncbi:MAG: DUF1385 domain-containing protein [Chloroflexota bacterium]